MKSITWKQFGIFTLLLIGLILAFSPIKQNEYSKESEIDIANEIVNKTDHISAEELGKMIIDGAPDFIVIDIRNKEDYEAYHIESSVNIPMDKLFIPETLDALDPQKLLVICSNGGTHAAQAWVLLKQHGFEYSTVLLGGINYWVDVYKNPEKPSGYYAEHDMFRYQFLKSAGERFFGNKQTVESNTEVTKPLKIKPRRRPRKKKAADEGC